MSWPLWVAITWVGVRFQGGPLVLQLLPHLDRTQPSLPRKPGRAGTMTHDYKRNGTVDLFAAMNLATGEVLTDFQKGHAATDVLRFFKQIDAAVPRGLAVHVVLDNLSAHSAPEITTWLAHKNRHRWHLHSLRRRAHG
jgi:hypothetical protein